MFVLIEGKAEVSIDGLPFELLESGSFAGEMGVIDGLPRYATVTALSKCKFVVINKERFHFLIDETPGFAIDVMKVTSRTMRSDQRVMDSLKSLSAIG